MGDGYFSDKEPRELKGKVYFVAFFVFAAFFVLAARLWHLQVFNGSHWRELSENNSTRSIKSGAARGIVYDREGNVLAENRPGFDLNLVPEDVTDWEKTKEMLKKLVDLDEEAIEKKIGRKNRPPFRAVKLKEGLTWEEAVRVESFKFEMPGVILDVSPKRHYPHGEATAHLIGYMGEISERELEDLREEGYDPGDLIGKYGVERRFESEIKGTDGVKELEVDALGRKIRVVKSTTPYSGSSVTLTIDLRAQLAAWKAMNGRAGAVVAMEPSTGRVLALVSAPFFDPNKLSSGVTKEEWKAISGNPLNLLMNRAIQGLYPPASTFKPLHAAAALEENIITPRTIIHAGPSFSFAGRQYRDWKEEGHGNINFYRAIVESSDTFFYQTGLKLGIRSLASYAERFGYGTKTGIDLGNEKSGLVPTPEWKKKVYRQRWYDGETISIAVGQGFMLVTPLQLLNSYCAIANGGTLYRPQIIEKIERPSGEEVKAFSPEALKTVGISPGTLERIRKALLGVVDEDFGTAHFLKAADLEIAGKTGTAQATKLYYREKDVRKIAYRNRDHAWFVGYAPASDPKIAVVVIVEHGGFGSSAAAPIAQEVFRAFLGEEEPEPDAHPLPVQTVKAEEVTPHDR